MKTQTRIIAEQIQDITGESLIQINRRAGAYVDMGICKDQIEALNYLLELVRYV